MLEHVLWLGGCPGAGKTAVATRLARQYGLRWYGSDTRTWRHRDRALREGSEAAHRWETLSPEQRVHTSPRDMLAMSLHTERGQMVLDDLRALPSSPLVLAEGSALPARAVDPARALWLLPTREFQRSRLRERGTEPTVVTLYQLLAETIEREAREYELPVLRIDGAGGLDATVAAVEERFAGALAQGPRAETRAERRALLREANEEIAAQVRGYYAHPWAKGVADSAVKDFLCECGDPACTENVELPVGALTQGPALAAGHR